MMSSGHTYYLTDNVLQSLNCPICKDRYETPKILKCYHIFCKRCLDRYIQIKESNFPPCPICRQRISYIPTKGADTFPTLTFFQDLINNIVATEETPAEDICHACKTFGIRIEVVCLTCDKKLCKNCAVAHAAFRSTADHTVFTAEEYRNAQLSEIIAKRSVACEFHADNVLNLHCSQCNVVLCVLCGLINHSRHTINDLRDRVTECRNKIECINEDLALRIQDREKKLENVADAMMKFQTNIYQTELDISTDFDRKIELLQKQRDEMLKQLRAKDEEVQKRFLLERDAIELQKIQAESLRDFIRVVRQYSSDIDIVKQSNVIEERWKEGECETYGLEEFDISVKYIPNNEIESHKQGQLEVTQTLSLSSAFKSSKISDSGDVISLSASPNLVSIVTSSPSFYSDDVETRAYDYNGKTHFTSCSQSDSDSSHVTVLINETRDSPSNVFMVNHREGRTKATILSNTGIQLHQFFLNSIPSCIAANPNGGVFLYNSWQGIKLYNLGGTVVNRISSVAGKPEVKLIAANKIGDISLVGETSNQTLFCKIMNIEGKTEFEHTINQSDGPWTLPAQAKALSIDNNGNIIFVLECLRKEKKTKFIFKTEKIVHDRHLFLMSKDGKRRENLVLPKSLGPLIDVKNMSLKTDGELILAVKTSSSVNVITVRYLS